MQKKRAYNGSQVKRKLNKVKFRFIFIFGKKCTYLIVYQLKKGKNIFTFGFVPYTFEIIFSIIALLFISLLSLQSSPGDSSPSFYAGDEAGFFAL